MSIIVFSKNGCAPCRTLVMWLERKGVSYTKKDLETPENASLCVKLSGSLLAPTILIEKDGERQIVSGLNFGRLSELLNI